MNSILIQKRWFRGLFNKRTFYRSNGIWHDIRHFKKGEIIHDIDGKWNTLCYCRCGNELVHSQSFLRERYVSKTNQFVYDYRCSFCGTEQYYNPDIIPALLKCDKDGLPI